MKTVCVLFAIGLLGCKVLAADFGSARAIQIINPVNHSFELQLDELKPILESDELKDRHVMVVSVAGATREGKSFLLNFFIKYLNAQYKKHDVSDWIGENENSSTLDGFKWRAGRKRETMGIWMWSEVFTHDYDNGDKVAIILLDTQGIFDDKSSVRDCTTIFALSMMLSSVQCYNTIHNVLEDSLQHLELYTEYSRLALEQSNEKPFQKLLFVVRDWPFGYETNFGWHGQKVIDEILADNDEQTPEMKRLRKRLYSNFNDIGAFLMPHPGKAVAQDNSFTGDLKQIDPEFVQNVKELAPGLFAPEKLIVKTINGEKVRAQDLVQHLQKFVNILNGKALPEPKAVFEATAEANNLVLHKDLLDFYVDKMQKLVNDAQFFSDNELENVHQKTKSETVEMFQRKPKLGGDKFTLSFQRQIEADIDERFDIFKQTNDEKRSHFIDKASVHNKKLINKIIASVEEKIEKEIVKLPSKIKYSKLNMFFVVHQTSALEEFDSRKMGDAEISKNDRDKLNHDLIQLHTDLIKISESYNEYLYIYATAMQELLDSSASYFGKNELIRIHQTKKADTLEQFSEQKTGGNHLAIAFHRKIEKYIDEQFIGIEQQNEKKREEFIKAANTHNENVCREIKVMFENKILNGIGSSYLDDDTFINLFMRSKVDSLKDFESRKMGDSTISNNFREKLERELDDLQSNLKRKNEANKPPPNNNHNRIERLMDIGVNLLGGIAGGALIG